MEKSGCGMIRFFLVFGLVSFFVWGLLLLFESQDNWPWAAIGLFGLILVKLVGNSAERIAKRNKKLRPSFSEKVMGFIDALKREWKAAMRPIPRGRILPHKISGSVPFEETPD